MRLIHGWLGFAALAMVACSGNDEVIPIDAFIPVDGVAVDAAVDAALQDTSPGDAPLVQSCQPNILSVTVNEGATAVFTIRLMAQPPSATTATITISDADVITAAPLTAVFNAATWNTPQTITVTGVVDGDAVSETATATCTVSGGAPGVVNVMVVDA